MRMFYAVIYTIIWPFFNLVHPHRAIGRERIPEGGVLVCGNHTSLSDPLFLAFAFHKKYQLRPMAKAELLRVPFIGWILKRVGVFGVERGKSDVGAIKQAMKYLKEGEKVLLYPEGTRSAPAAERRANPKPGRPCWRCGAASPSSLCMCRKKALVWTDARGYRRALSASCGVPQGNAGGV
ncbi:MAG: lysophospholipid acyltransferase family protein [Intestinimonas sp.]